jgi:diguanylate cyclase (GGDEF)-like protein
MSAESPASLATILVVDDNPNNLRVLENMLTGAGFRILPALNGETALRAAQAALPDLVLLDVRMPGMDGYEVCRRLKDVALTRDLPVIFISALQETEDKLQAFRAGGVDYITKPFQSEEVLSRVRTHVELSHSRRQLAQANEHLEEVVEARTLALTESNAQLELAMRHEQALRQLLALSHAALAIDEYLQQGLKQLSENFGWRAPQRKSAVFLTQSQGDGKPLEMVASIGIVPGQIGACANLCDDDCLCGEAASRQQIISIDAAHVPNGLRFSDPEPRGRIALPLISGGKTLGVLMHSIEGNAAVGEGDQRLLEQVADVLTMTIARRYADERIAYMAYHDELTGLMNRVALIEKLSLELLRADRHVGGFAVLFIDFDHFKQINDVLGHDVGDSYLQISSQRLLRALRTGDVPCRWGSDEFVVLALDLGEDVERAVIDAQAVAIKIAEVLAQPVSAGGQDLQLNVSVGIALHPGDGANAAELVQHAELAMSRAKQAGRNLIHFYRPEMQSEAARRMTLGRELRRAIEEQQFVLHYQPQVDVDGRLLGAEALVRWQHPTRGLVSPLEFIPIAEELGLIVPLGDWVLAESVRWLGSLHAGVATPKLPMLSVNVSARQFHEAGFAERCLRVLDEVGMLPECIELEVTESLLLADIEGARSKISALREAGFFFAVDDFGTGYSSLAYLKSLPVQKLKIDRSFVQDVHLDSRNAAIVHTIISLAKNLGMTTIAEGVEQLAEVDFLRAAGCDSFQGYYFGKPVAAADFEKTWLR